MATNLSSALSRRVAWPREKCWGFSRWPSGKPGGVVRTRAAGTSIQVSLLAQCAAGTELVTRKGVGDAIGLGEEQQRQGICSDSVGGRIGATTWAEWERRRERTETCLEASEDVVDVLLVFGRGHGCCVCVIECRRGLRVGGGLGSRSQSTRQRFKKRQATSLPTRTPRLHVRPRGTTVSREGKVSKTKGGHALGKR